MKRTESVQKQKQRLNALGQIRQEKKGSNEENCMCSKTKTETECTWSNGNISYLASSSICVHKRGHAIAQAVS
jgi:hypothetical protein